MFSRNEPAILGPSTCATAPQFYLGNPEAGFRVEVAWSLHCEYTQKLYKGGFDDLIENALSRNDALIVFHHLSRTQEEIAISELLLSLEPELYGPTFLVVLEHFSNRGFNPNIRQVQSLIEKLEVPVDQSFNKESARYSTALLNVYLTKKEGCRRNPFIVLERKVEGWCHA